jgi:multiple sugar transport system ATP-binding protein
MSSVQLQHISKTYDNKFNAVKDVSFEVKNGEFVVLVGPSGCGKTTTLRMIAGLEDITDGKLLIDEKEMNTVAPKDRDIAMVFQNYALYPHKSVYENLAFSLRLRKFPKPEIDTRVREAAKILSIENILENKPKTLSGGQRQRVAVGRAIVRHPKVFLFDEPLSNLDAQLRVQMRTELLKIHNRLGATMVYVTHDQTEAMTLGDRIVVMKDGVVQQIDAPMDLYAAPNNMFVAEFIGSPPMNFLNGRLERASDGSIAFQEQSGGVKVSLPSSSPEALAKYVDREVIAGVRPENMSFSNNGSNSYLAPVEVVELLGSDMLVYATTPSGVVRIRCDADERRPALAEKVSLQIAPNKVHFFDPATTLRIH